MIPMKAPKGSSLCAVLEKKKLFSFPCPRHCFLGNCSLKTSDCFCCIFWGKFETELSLKWAGEGLIPVGVLRETFLHDHVQAEVQCQWPQAQMFITLPDTRHHFSLWNHRSYMFFHNWALRKAQWPLEIWIHSSMHCKGERGCCMDIPPWAVLPNQNELSPEDPDCSKCCP